MDMNSIKKAICVLAAACMGVVAVHAQSGEAVLTGTIKDYAGQDTLFCYFGEAGEGYDTISIRKDGTFRLAKPMEEERDVTVFWQGRHARKHDQISVVMAPGKTLHVEIMPRQLKSDSVRLEAVFSGEGAVKSEFANLFSYYFSRTSELSAETLVRLPNFKACRDYVNGRMDEMTAILDRVDDSMFVKEERDNLAKLERNVLFSYAEAKEKAGRKMEQDADFMAFAKRVDLNDTTQVDDICNYLEWYYAAHADSYKPLSANAAQLKCLGTLVSNQDVRNMVANRQITGVFFLMSFGANPASPEMKDFYEQYLDVVTDTTYTSFVKSQLEIIKRSEPGQPAMDFPINMPEGETVGFKSLVGGGKVVYVDFWATWCMPCRREIPYLAKLAEYYKDNNRVRIISVSIDTDVAAWKKMIAADKPAWEQYNIPNPDDSEGVKYYNITGIPRFILFDREGKLCKFSASRPSDEATKALIDSLIK